MKLWAQKLLEQSRKRPLAVMFFGGVLVYVAWGTLQPVPVPVARQPIAKAQAVPDLGMQKDKMTGTLLEMQKGMADMKEALQGKDRELREMRQAQQTREQERQRRDEAQKQQMQHLLQQAEDAQRQMQTQLQAVKQAQTQKPVVKPTGQKKEAATTTPSVTTPTEVQQHGEAGPKIRILRSKQAPSFQGQPPSATRGDTPFLPAGSFANGRVITGVIATSRAGGALPVLFSVAQEFHAPFQLNGPGLTPIATALPMQGCFMFGKAQGDLGASRVIVQLDLLSCVFPDGAAFERPVRGYAVDADGALGLFCKVETHDSAYLARTFLTSLMAGAGEAFASARRTVSVTPFGGQVGAVTGNTGELAGFSALAQAAAQLSQFYLQQAQQLMPTLRCESGKEARLVLQEGVALEGLPTSISLTRKGLPE
jgi:hypothetical protein